MPPFRPGTFWAHFTVYALERSWISSLFVANGALAKLFCQGARSSRSVRCASVPFQWRAHSVVRGGTVFNLVHIVGSQALVAAKTHVDYDKLIGHSLVFRAGFANRRVGLSVAALGGHSVPGRARVAAPGCSVVAGVKLTGRALFPRHVTLSPYGPACSNADDRKSNEQCSEHDDW
ncbi:hypothetical protein [Mandarin fish ranavirus]|nr:hypothetical protein [Mandarin fish ranavirus]